MDFYNVIEKRTSNKTYKSTAIPTEKLDKMIHAALMAPSWKNETCYRFVFINDSTQKEKIASAILNDDNEAVNAVMSAPLVAIIVGNPSESGTIDGKPYFMIDCGIAMEHLILAATNEGYGTCWIGSFDESAIRMILNIPSKFRVVAMTPIGETEENDEHYPPKDTSSHIYYNRWENTDR